MNLLKLLDQARDLREKGKASLALNKFNEVLFLGQKNKDYRKIIEGLGDRAIVWRHLFEEKSDPLFAILARKDAETMLELVKLWGVEDKLHTAYYLLGQAALLFEEYAEAEKYFFKSLRYFKGDGAEKGSWKYHWGKALYMTGQKKKALLAFAAGIHDIKKNANKTDSFLTHVYLSGAYVNLAYVLLKDDPKESLKYFQEAKKIVSSDKRLIVRSRQIDRLSKRFEGLSSQK
jgi:tetratricopeptide (TPR) repeat protein